jgi:hypothetical protein
MVTRSKFDPELVKRIRKHMDEQTSLLQKCRPPIGKNPSKASIHSPSSTFWEYKAKTDNPEEWARIEAEREEHLQTYVKNRWFLPTI